MLEYLPFTLITMVIERRSVEDIQTVPKSDLPNLEALGFSLDLPQEWKYEQLVNRVIQATTTFKLETVVFGV